MLTGNAPRDWWVWSAKRSMFVSVMVACFFWAFATDYGRVRAEDASSVRDVERLILQHMDADFATCRETSVDFECQAGAFQDRLGIEPTVVYSIRVPRNQLGDRDSESSAAVFSLGFGSSSPSSSRTAAPPAPALPRTSNAARSIRAKGLEVRRVSPRDGKIG
jgi:hypothetical protein